MSFLFYSAGEENSTSPSPNKTNIKEANEHIQGLYTKVSQLEKEREIVLQQLRLKENEYSALEKALEQRQEIIAHRDVRIQTLDMTISEQEEIIEEIQSKVVDYQMDLAAKAEAVQNLDLMMLEKESIFDKIQSKVMDYQRVLATKDEIIQSLNLTVRARETEAKSLTETVTELSTESAQRKVELNSSLEERQKLKEQLHLKDLQHDQAGQHFNALKSIISYSSSIEKLLEVLKQTTLLPSLQPESPSSSPPRFFSSNHLECDDGSDEQETVPEETIDVSIADASLPAPGSTDDTITMPMLMVNTDVSVLNEVDEDAEENRERSPEPKMSTELAEIPENVERLHFAPHKEKERIPSVLLLSNLQVQTYEEEQQYSNDDCGSPDLEAVEEEKNPKREDLNPFHSNETSSEEVSTSTADLELPPVVPSHVEEHLLSGESDSIDTSSGANPDLPADSSLSNGILPNGHASLDIVDSLLAKHIAEQITKDLHGEAANLSVTESSPKSESLQSHSAPLEDYPVLNGRATEMDTPPLTPTLTPTHEVSQDQFLSLLHPSEDVGQRSAFEPPRNVLVKDLVQSASAEFFV